LLAFIDETARQGFVPAAQQELLQVDADPASLLDRLAALARKATEADDYRSI
jgi:hypothetical protein